MQNMRVNSMNINKITIMSGDVEIQKNIINVCSYQKNQHITSLLFCTEDNEIIWFVEDPIRLDEVLQNPPSLTIPSYAIKRYMWFKLNPHTYEWEPYPAVKEVAIMKNCFDPTPEISNKGEIFDL